MLQSWPEQGYWSQPVKVTADVLFNTLHGEGLQAYTSAMKWEISRPVLWAPLVWLWLKRAVQAGKVWASGSSCKHGRGQVGWEGVGHGCTSTHAGLAALVRGASAEDLL